MNNMWNCHILSPQFSGLWSWTEHQYHNEWFASRPMDYHGGIRFSSFIIAELIVANENEDLLILVDYGRIINVTVELPL